MGESFHFPLVDTVSELREVLLIAAKESGDRPPARLVVSQTAVSIQHISPR